eukprot:scaffold645_cov417-Prasinococcus_capsulatus_cf.AAC.4
MQGWHSSGSTPAHRELRVREGSEQLHKAPSSLSGGQRRAFGIILTERACRAGSPLRRPARVRVPRTCRELPRRRRRRPAPHESRRRCDGRPCVVCRHPLPSSAHLYGNQPPPPSSGPSPSSVSSSGACRHAPHRGCSARAEGAVRVLDCAATRRAAPDAPFERFFVRAVEPTVSKTEGRNRVHVGDPLVLPGRFRGRLHAPVPRRDGGLDSSWGLVLGPASSSPPPPPPASAIHPSTPAGAAPRKLQPATGAYAALDPA